jgi:hypothetical protein
MFTPRVSMQLTDPASGCWTGFGLRATQGLAMAIKKSWSTKASSRKVKLKGLTGAAYKRVNVKGHSNVRRTTKKK